MYFVNVLSLSMYISFNAAVKVFEIGFSQHLSVMIIPLFWQGFNENYGSSVY